MGCRTFWSAVQRGMKNDSAQKRRENSCGSMPRRMVILMSIPAQAHWRTQAWARTTKKMSNVKAIIQVRPLRFPPESRYLLLNLSRTERAHLLDEPVEYHNHQTYVKTDPWTYLLSNLALQGTPRSCSFNVWTSNISCCSSYHQCMAMSGWKRPSSRWPFKTKLRSDLLTQIKDNDDDGETAAGGRLAHLLQILVCTRFPGALFITHPYLALTGGQQRTCRCHSLLRWYSRGCRDHNPGPGAGWLVGSSGR